ncbi:manganese efflux pump [Sporosarcina oncorhynchi]|uniref:Manganese efflux pump n=1 Tax=Sporosarcina oncorhynchi TaxID=3056444 RepID=A0ABZ0L9B2_9BACL|nr:manganese efflux pump [Sporosarcina sp. T2O-4]WOV89121.1 manganese efflux pump [Sporosarcina sp. T2O-4]
MEIIAAGITTIDVIIVYSLMRLRKGRLVLALWTMVLNMAFPFLGFIMGDWTVGIFSAWSQLLSGILLALIGLHMLLQQDGNDAELTRQLHPTLIALAVSLDTFSVSVSFGMLQLNKMLFIFASGLLALFFSCVALYYGRRISPRNGKFLRKLSGLALLTMGVLSWFR